MEPSTKTTRKVFSFVLSFFMIFTNIAIICPTTASAKNFKCLRAAKYVFYFIGDGMASPQIHAAEHYLAALENDDAIPGAPKAEYLTMSKFPVQGMATTYANNRFITGSAAAGTALACGMKTNINVIAMDPSTTVPYTSIAELAKQRGKKVGIVSSVSIDHATPAVFYAHQPTRKMYHEIGHDLVNSGFDYFGGGGFVKPDGPLGNVLDAAVAAGYEIVTTREDLQATQLGDKVIAMNHTLDGSSKALYYELDRPDDHISLAEFTRQGIELLYDPSNRHGFFMMVEGGKIDWALHANDARAAIDDTIAFDEAIKEAIKFYKRHPRETLIVVTGDHECGGLSLGFAGTGYETAFEVMENQTKSYVEFGKVLADYIANGSPAEDLDNSALEPELATSFGLVYDDLTAHEKGLLEDAYDASVNGHPYYNYTDYPEEFLLYGGYDPLAVTCTHVLNRKAGIAFTSYYHTGVPVPVLALGKHSHLFHGFYDNTDVAKKIARAMRVYLNN
jgi:alkaline phosphatase